MAKDRASTGLRSRGYQVRILAAAPSRVRRPRPPIPHPTIADAMLVPLTKGLYATIDAADASVVGHRSWRAHKASDGFVYASRMDGPRGRQRRVYMHRVLWAAWNGPVCPVVDHRSTDTLDNRRENLRAATHSQNHANAPRRADNASGFKGVTRNGRRWMASITIDGARTYLGTFDTASEAGIAYLTASVRHFGEFARAS